MTLFLPPEDPALNKPAIEVCVDQIPSTEIQSIIDQMMEIAKGKQIDTGDGVMVGLAAPQI